MSAGCASTGATFPGATGLTVIEELFGSLRLPSLAETVALYGEPVASPVTGARWTTPRDRETVTNVGPDTIVYWSGSPSGSVALKICSAVPPSVTVMSAGCVRAGARFVLVTVTVRDLESLSEPSLADTVAAAVPESEKPGAKWMVPVVSFVVV